MSFLLLTITLQFGPEASINKYNIWILKKENIWIFDKSKQLLSIKQARVK